MEQQKIGAFLKALRKDKGMTQEQLAEKFNVSNRTISRWETGSNLPDLGLLVTLAEFYDVDIREIIKGERENENMDGELKDTLQKVADYSNMEKTKIAQAGNIAFGVAFIVSVIAIIVQLFITRSLLMVAGENLILIIGGIVYFTFIVKNGAWRFAKMSTPKSYTIISTICGVIFSMILFIYLYREDIELTKLVWLTIIFFVVIVLIGKFLLMFLDKKGNRK